jgi:hypothetical protein
VSKASEVFEARLADLVKISEQMAIEIEWVAHRLRETIRHNAQDYHGIKMLLQQGSERGHVCRALHSRLSEAEDLAYAVKGAES